MLKRKIFLNAYHAKCDVCKRLGRIKDKLELEKNGALVGEITICPTCLSVILPHLNFETENEAKILEEAEGQEVIEDPDEFDDITEDEYYLLKSNSKSVQKLF